MVLLPADDKRFHALLLRKYLNKSRKKDVATFPGQIKWVSSSLSQHDLESFLSRVPFLLVAY